MFVSRSTPTIQDEHQQVINFHAFIFSGEKLIVLDPAEPSKSSAHGFGGDQQSSHPVCKKEWNVWEEEASQSMEEISGCMKESWGAASRPTRPIC